MAPANLPPIFNATSQDIEMLLAAQCHLGSKNLQVHMEPYLWKTRPDGINVINIGKTWLVLPASHSNVYQWCKTELHGIGKRLSLRRVSLPQSTILLISLSSLLAPMVNVRFSSSPLIPVPSQLPDGSLLGILQITLLDRSRSPVSLSSPIPVPMHKPLKRHPMSIFPSLPCVILTHRLNLWMLQFLRTIRDGMRLV